MHNDISRFIVEYGTSLTDALRMIQENARGIVFVTDPEGILCGCMTDGDARRFLLKTGQLNASVNDVMNDSPKYLSNSSVDKSDDIMAEYKITALPIVDHQGHVVDIILRDAMEYKEKKSLRERRL